MLKIVVKWSLRIMQGHWYSEEHVRDCVSHRLCLCLYLAPFPNYFTLENIVTLESTFRVIHPENLCKDCTSVKSTDRWLYLRRWLYASVFIHFYTANCGSKLCRAAILKIAFFGYKSSTDCPISAKFCMRKQNGMSTRAKWQHLQICKIQDGGRPPFRKSLNRHISLNNRPILMKFGTL